MHGLPGSRVKLNRQIVVGILALVAQRLLAGEQPPPATAPELASDVCSSDLAFEIDGLKKSVGNAVLKQGVYGLGGGGLCAASEFVVTKPLTIYRLSAWHTPDYDKWWTFELPSGSASEYRKRYVMGGDWPVNYRTTCTLKVGTTIAVGYGQSSHARSASKAIQVFVAGDRDAVKAQMEDKSCDAVPSLMEP